MEHAGVVGGCVEEVRTALRVLIALPADHSSPVRGHEFLVIDGEGEGEIPVCEVLPAGAGQRQQFSRLGCSAMYGRTRALVMQVKCKRCGVYV